MTETFLTATELGQRPMTADEVSEYLASREKAEIAKQNEEAAKVETQIKRQTALAKLAALGLEEADLKALGL